MSKFKIIKNAAGELVCFGPNNGMYEPNCPDGCTLHIVDVLPPLPPTPYQELRAAAYPPATDYLDAIVKGDQAQLQAYIASCLAVKTRYPKS